MLPEHIDFEAEETEGMLLPHDIVSLQHMHNDIKMTSLLLKLNKYKETGIDPDWINPPGLRSNSQSLNTGLI